MFSGRLHPARVRLRPDLVTSPPQVGEARRWIVKDPIALRYYTFRAEEYAILQWLDGSSGLELLKERFEAAFAPQRMTTARLQEFLANLHRNGLLISEEPGQAPLLLEREQSQKSQWWRSWMDVLSLRFRGVDPDRALSRLRPRLAWLFSPAAVAAYALVVISALLLLFSEWREFRAQLPSIGEFMSARNLAWLAIVLGATKVVHELGHAVACKHFGGECHEMGVMLLVFTPCLYCNVTDSWMLRSRRQRIAISGAGIVVEIGLAALAIFGWWFTQPGLVHSICMNVVLVCGASTIIFNGNPLLRYDGYYILSDLWGIPNLWQESRLAVQQSVERLFVLRGDGSPQRHGREATLVAYGLASMTYRVVVSVGIILFLYRWLQPIGLAGIAYVAAASLVVSTAVNWFRFFSSPGRVHAYRRRGKKLVGAVSLALLVLAVITFFYVPLPYGISAPALIQPAGAHRLYVSTPGTLVSGVTAGEHVKAGQVVARLEDAELGREVADRRAEYESALTRVKHLEVRASVDATAAAELVVAREACADAKERLNRRLREESGLELKAPAAGVAIPPPPRRAAAEDGQLAAWSGNPLEKRNANCYLDRGTLFCMIGDPAEQEAVVYLDGADAPFVRNGQRVRLRFDVGPTALVTGTVAEVAQGIVKTAPAELAADQELATRTDTATGQLRLLRTAYQARIQLDDASGRLLIGSRGRAKVEVARQTLSQRLYRLLQRTLAVEI